MHHNASTRAQQAVIFDLDGVIIDSEEWWDEVRTELATTHGREWPAEATRAMQGMSTNEWSTYLAETVGIPRTAPDIANKVIETMAARYAAELPLITGAVETVRTIAEEYVVAIASSSPRILIDTVLAESGLDPAVAYSLSTEQVAAGKPSPAVYLAVAAELDCDPKLSVAIEDSSNGLRSAHAAGLLVVAVPNPTFPPTADALDLADAVIADISLLNVEVVQRLIASRQ